MQGNATDNAKEHICGSQQGMGEGARVLITGAAAFIVLFGLKYTREFTVPLVVAIFLATISYPFTSAMKRIKLPHWLAVICTLALDIALIYGLIFLLNYLAADVRATLRSNFLAVLGQKLSICLEWLDHIGVGDEMRRLLTSPLELVNPEQILSISQSLTGHIFSFMSVTTIILILMTFILGEVPLFSRNFQRLPNSMQGKEQLTAALRGMQKYLLIKTIASVSTGLLAWLLCSQMRIPFAFLWGVVACVLNFIPTIGSIIAAIPPILLSLVLQDWGSVCIVTGGYLAINFAIGNGIEPFFTGKQFGIATTVVLISVIIWGWVWGPIGMLLAVPITVLTKLAMENSMDLYWVAVIIDDNPCPKDQKPKLNSNST